MNYTGALGAIKPSTDKNPEEMFVNERGNTLDFARSMANMLRPNMGIYLGTEDNRSGGEDQSPKVFVEDAHYGMVMQAFGGVAVKRMGGKVLKIIKQKAAQ